MIHIWNLFQASELDHYLRLTHLNRKCLIFFLTKFGNSGHIAKLWLQWICCCLATLQIGNSNFLLKFSDHLAYLLKSKLQNQIKILWNRKGNKFYKRSFLMFEFLHPLLPLWFQKFIVSIIHLIQDSKLTIRVCN